MILTIEQLDAIRGRPVNRENAGSLILAVTTHPNGLELPHRLAQFLAQVFHESAELHHVREIWGPTPTQKRYEGRLDLGNNQPGDGERFLGRGLLQTTGRFNYRVLSRWCDKRPTLGAPDFEFVPMALENPPWSGIAAVAYWEMKGLNNLADVGDIKGITQAVNGGLNGFKDRMKWYVRAGLTLLGHPTDVRAFQGEVGLKVDGVPGPLTCAAMHPVLKALTAPPKTTTERLTDLEARVTNLEAKASPTTEGSA